MLSTSELLMLFLISFSFSWFSLKSWVVYVATNPLLVFSLYINKTLSSLDRNIKILK
ncbi:hypothetical protein K502DRAFT_238355 [Neoconidiobolus thromboides FSU 785]|nr:hypothetical protein K502DRAFT_238355 [Neoconidiobolus thromboides FSU 785]